MFGGFLVDFENLFGFVWVGEGVEYDDVFVVGDEGFVVDCFEIVC